MNPENQTIRSDPPASELVEQVNLVVLVCQRGGFLTGHPL